MEEKRITEELVDQLFDTLQKNSSLVDEWNDRLMETCEEDAWNEVAIKRSQICARSIRTMKRSAINSLRPSLPNRPKKNWRSCLHLLIIST